MYQYAYAAVKDQHSHYTMSLSNQTIHCDHTTLCWTFTILINTLFHTILPHRWSIECKNSAKKLVFLNIFWGKYSATLQSYKYYILILFVALCTYVTTFVKIRNCIVNNYGTYSKASVRLVPSLTLVSKHLMKLFSLANWNISSDEICLSPRGLSHCNRWGERRGGEGEGRKSKNSSHNLRQM